MGSPFWGQQRHSAPFQLGLSGFASKGSPIPRSVKQAKLGCARIFFLTFKKWWPIDKIRPKRCPIFFKIQCLVPPISVQVQQVGPGDESCQGQHQFYQWDDRLGQARKTWRDPERFTSHSSTTRTQTSPIHLGGHWRPDHAVCAPSQRRLAKNFQKSLSSQERFEAGGFCSRRIARELDSHSHPHLWPKRGHTWKSSQWLNTVKRTLIFCESKQSSKR